MPKTIKPCSEADYDEITELWEASVRATHHFLTEADILFFKPLIREQYLPAVELYAIGDGGNRIAAFIGLSDTLVEMLFVRPDMQGRGYGRRLLEFAVTEKKIRKVDVNEQNREALKFYEKLGFKVFARDETDSMGKPFPILHMRYDPYTVREAKDEDLGGVELRNYLMIKK